MPDCHPAQRPALAHQRSLVPRAKPRRPALRWTANPEAARAAETVPIAQKVIATLVEPSVSGSAARPWPATHAAEPIATQTKHQRRPTKHAVPAWPAAPGRRDANR